MRDRNKHSARFAKKHHHFKEFQWLTRNKRALGNVQILTFSLKEKIFSNLRQLRNRIMTKIDLIRTVM